MYKTLEWVLVSILKNKKTIILNKKNCKRESESESAVDFKAARTRNHCKLPADHIEDMAGQQLKLDLNVRKDD